LTSTTTNECLLKYQKFIEITEFNPKIIRCLFVNAYNQFLAGTILAEKGLNTPSFNCLRMGLESEWIGIILTRNREMGLFWAFGVGNDATQKQLIQLERPFEIRKNLGNTERITIKDRNEIYAALSDKSHTKMGSVTRFLIPRDAHPSDGYVDCIPPGGMREEKAVENILQGVRVVLSFALAEIEDSLGCHLLENRWTWNRNELRYISGGGYADSHGEFEPHITSKGHPGRDSMQLMSLLSAIRHGKI